ncbi:3-hydroxyisobutyrate dehydrogenase [Synchytrium endobioticum]|uniref:3-hydroxyisobutyrate dehydrogenase n=1 Tax=Synchytrium endobioticum TaxID=286115 RepID=A0A507CWL1_9FUNG|nr:3-hydroxyisobutyrate dehydrogenase [Synchytrium endobioticum]TPX43546.1 hypothetical protein SeMB42_g04684 [Synchytrium endobioticum]TPX43550.1 3-hydroxyisobutyrate dehydrogenase [Synchytrium endobioticum]
MTARTRCPLALSPSRRIFACRSYSTTRPHTIGFIGLGQMGYNMAANLLAKTSSSHLVISDTSEPVLARFTDQHAQHTHRIAVAHTPQAVAQQCDMLITMLPQPHHVRAVYLGPAGVLHGLRPGCVCIDASTVDPATARAVHAAVGARAAMLDAPVSGGIAGAKNATLTFMVGGPRAAFARATPVLECMGSRIEYCGDAGSGQAVKICNNMMLGIAMLGAAEAMNLGVRMGIDATLLARVLNASSGRCWALDSYNPCPGVMDDVPASRGYEGGFGNTLMAKDLGLAVQAANEVKSTVVLGSTALQIYNQVASTPGFENKDFSSVFLWLNDNLKKYQ